MVGLWALMLALTASDGTGPFKEGDRVVFVGDTIIERDAAYGYLETEVLRRFPSLKITFRNIGWSGDTPAGISRAYFDAPDVGFKRLVDQVKATKPTLLFIGYGMADSLENGDVKAFEASMNKFLDAIKGEPATRLVFLSPVALSPEQIKDEHHKLLEQYSLVILKVATERKGEFVDLFSKPIAKELIEANGIHLNQEGHRWFAGEILKQLNTSDEMPLLAVNQSPNKKTAISVGEFTAPMAPTTLPSAIVNKPTINVTNEILKPGKYTFSIEGSELLASSADEWKRAVPVSIVEWTGQTHRLRHLVRRKNELYFQRYRPQNITYLLGFRSYEQGQNAKEIEQLDPMIADLEKKIDEERMPSPHECTWIPAKGGK